MKTPTLYGIIYTYSDGSTYQAVHAGEQETFEQVQEFAKEETNEMLIVTAEEIAQLDPTSNPYIGTLKNGATITIQALSEPTVDRLQKALQAEPTALTPSERATILTALTYWKNEQDGNRINDAIGRSEFFSGIHNQTGRDIEPLNEQQTDALIERMNGETAQTPTTTSEAE